MSWELDPGTAVAESPAKPSGGWEPDPTTATPPSPSVKDRLSSAGSTLGHFAKDAAKTAVGTFEDYAKPINKQVEKIETAKGFGDKAIETLRLAGETAARPFTYGGGLAEALIKGFGGLVASAPKGIALLVDATTHYGEEHGVGKATESAAFVEELTKQLPLDPKTEAGKSAAKVLNLVPEAIHAAGETSYDLFGSAVLSAGVEGLATLVTLKPATAATALKGLMSGKNKIAAEEAFDNLAKEHLEEAQKAADHIKEADPELAKQLAARIKAITPDAKDVKAIFKKTIAESIARKEEALKREGGEMTPEHLKELFDEAKKVAAKNVEPKESPKSAEEKLANERQESQARQEADQLKQKQIDEAFANRDKHNPLVNTPMQASANLRDIIRQSLENAEADYTDLSTGETKSPTNPVMAAAMRNAANRGSRGRQRGSIDPSVFIDTAKEVTQLVKTGLTKIPLDRIIALRNQIYNNHYDNKNSTFEEMHEATAPLTAEIARREHLRLTKSPAKKIGEIYPGFTKIPHGTKVKVKDHLGVERTGTVVNTKTAVYDETLTHYPVLEFSDGSRKMTAFPSDIQEVYAPRGIKGGLGSKQGGAVDPSVFIEPVEIAFAALGKGLKGAKVGITASAIGRGIEQLTRSLNPEGLGEKAKQAAAIIGSTIAEKVHETTRDTLSGKARTSFFDKLGEDKAFKFILDSEKGKSFADAMLEKARLAYRAGYRAIYEADKKMGIDYAEVDHYFKHAFEPDPRLPDFLATERAKWGDPEFTKERDARLYEAALKKGFKPKFKNPEDLYQSRLLASREAHAKIDMLRELAEHGLARQLKKGDTVEVGEFKRRSPNGEIYALHDHAEAIVKNAFDSQGLYDLPGLAGLAVSAPAKAMLSLKNKLVPTMLTLSGFHPLHVLFIDAATEMARASAELAAGGTNSVSWAGRLAKATALLDTVKNPKAGGRLNRIWRGEIPKSEITMAEKSKLQWMIEGGFIPELSSQFRTNAIQKWKRAVDQGRAGAALWHTPWALLDAIQKPMFETWIPNMKSASYIKDVEGLLKAKPELLDNRLQRQIALRQIAKSVDNRYGEMNYDTLFAEKWVKDVGILSMLSMGWELGFIREYGGAAMETGAAGLDAGKKLIGMDVAKNANPPADRISKAMFVGMYTAQALTFGALMTYFMGGQTPKTMDDLVNPQIGGQDKEGKQNRVSTMFLTREFSALGHETASEGFANALGTYAMNKIGPGPKLVENIFTNLDHFNHQISNPDADWLARQGQRLDYIMTKGHPISLKDWGNKTPKERALQVAGFSPAPKYVNDSVAMSTLKSIYNRDYEKVTPYEQGEKGKDAAVLRKAKEDGDAEAYSEQLGKMKEKYHLDEKEVAKLKHVVNHDPQARMFKALTHDQQILVIKKAEGEEKERFLKLAKPQVKKTLQEAE